MTIAALLDVTPIFDASFLPAMLVALLGGLISFLSPCVLPVVPPYLAYMSGVSMDDMSDEKASRRRIMITALFFVMGLSVVFLLIGAAASVFGRFLIVNQGYFVIGAGLVIMILGAHFVGVYRLRFLDREYRMDAGDQGGSAFGAFVLGLAFAFGWSPCLGPVLGAISSLAMVEHSVGRGMALLGVYAFGLGIPFLLVAAFFPRLKGPLNWMKRNMERIERTMGLLLWTVGLMMATGKFTDFALWLNEAFPALQTFG
ncbi:cytochrome c biogenesis CcdA family protein [Cochlodiniinecator piscidefendens]|uniref:cytochrome c biogenesis CcdA family protein n=1 Tax=Cochlodiniinecator piscidefendens TaxID=2715756 RepID=UPI00140CDC31|nr:cytochrome c biogenesis protein CcdA [Cochlodiniinecator piscidefendens]